MNEASNCSVPVPGHVSVTARVEVVWPALMISRVADRSYAQRICIFVPQHTSKLFCIDLAIWTIVSFP